MDRRRSLCLDHWLSRHCNSVGQSVNCKTPAASRLIVKMQLDDGALVFRLPLSLGEHRLAVTKKDAKASER